MERVEKFLKEADTSISFSSYYYFPCYNLFIEIRKLNF